MDFFGDSGFLFFWLGVDISFDYKGMFFYRSLYLVFVFKLKVRVM